MTGESRGFGEKPIQATFPGAVHNPLSCPACAVIHAFHKLAEPKWFCPDCKTLAANHRFAPLGPRRGYLWTTRADGSIKICVPNVVIDSPPRNHA